jgi:hypothetical protein
MGVLFRIGVGVVGAAAAYWGFKEMRLAGAASDTPTRMTCRELGEKGAAGNAHVVMTDFLLTGDLVYQHKKKSSDADKWKKVWVPAVPSDGEYAKALIAAGGERPQVPPPRPIGVIVVSTDTKNDRELEALGAKDELDGMVTNLIHELGHEEKKLLEESYGDVSKAQIFEVGRKPAGAMLSLLAIVGGAALVAGAIWSFVRRKRPLPPEPAAPAQPV